MSQETITILCSGASLGAYIPGLVASHQLNRRGFKTEVVVLETILFDAKRDNVPKTKFAFHRNFSLALMGQKLAKDISPSIDPKLADQLLTRWLDAKQKHFMMFSGFWLPIIHQYLQTCCDRDINNQDITIDLCHMDASISTSWKLYDTSHASFRHSWLFNLDDGRVQYHFPISDHAPIPYNQRNGRFLIHGGGWGVGTYKSTIPALEAQGFKLDIIAYEQRDLTQTTSENRYFMIDPEWKPWEKYGQEQHQFPPFAEVKDHHHINFQNSNPYPDVYPLIQHSQAIISKPGGGTLVDSLAAATPLILLDPYGDYERANGQLWQDLGFAITYEQWVDANYSLNMLAKLHTNLCQARTQLPNYIDSYIRYIDHYAETVSNSGG